MNRDRAGRCSAQGCRRRSGRRSATSVGAAGAARETADGFRVLEADARPGAARAAPAALTQALGYGGATPGPLLRLRKGEELKDRLVNRLAQPTSLSWPGLRIANAMAGIGGLTQPPVPPGASFDYRFTPPDAGFNLYRPHVGAASAGQIARGLYGPIVVDEVAPPPTRS